MKLLATISDSDVFPGNSNDDPSSFYKRQASRAIVLGSNNEVYLLHISRDHYHKLPGGGVDKGEDIKAALARELSEEIGCTAEVINEVGEIVEYRNNMRWIQTSYCFIAKQVGELGSAHLEDSEIEAGAKTKIVNSVAEAIEILEQDKTEDYEGNFILKRDLVFLRAAKELLEL